MWKKDKKKGAKSILILFSEIQTRDARQQQTFTDKNKSEFFQKEKNLLIGHKRPGGKLQGAGE